ncbi:MAG: substrate-binding domain-containing protein [Chloroflexi bacterium]|nr:substrate-binding domain-containing protein [Chloroflexota bacterium]
MRASRTAAAGLSAMLLATALSSGALAQSPEASMAAPMGSPAVATPGQDVKMLLLPKFLGILPFDQANQGAMEAAAELQNPTAFDFTGPAAGDPPATQIDYVTNAPTQGYKVVMMSNNAGEQTSAAAVAAQAAGTKVVTWDSPIPSGVGENVFVAQVDFNDIGGVMAQMSRDILGPDGGTVAILSAGPDSAIQNAWNAAYAEALKTPDFANITVVETVYGNDSAEDSYNQANALLDKYPDLGLIMSPTSVGIVAAAKAVTDAELCDTVKISGLGLPADMLDYTLSGCAPEFTLWSFVDLGYLTYYTSYLLATGAIQGVAGESFDIGRPVSGQTTFTITADPTRPDTEALRVLMGPFTVYNKDNVEAASK